MVCLSNGGDLDSTEIWFRRMRAEDHQPRKSDGKKPNCGHAARTRSLNPCERLLRSACGPERDVILVGWRLPVALDGSGETSLGLAPGGSGRGFTSGARFQTRIRIVDSCEDVFSDPGANPGASTNLRSHVTRRLPAVAPRAKAGCPCLRRASAGKPTFDPDQGEGCPP